MRLITDQELLWWPDATRKRISELVQKTKDKLDQCDLAVQQLRVSLGEPQLEDELDDLNNDFALLEVVKELQRCAQLTNKAWWQLCYQKPGWFSFLGAGASWEIERQRNEVSCVRTMQADIVQWSENLDMNQIKQVVCPMCRQKHPIIFKCVREYEGTCYNDDHDRWDNRLLVLCREAGVQTYARIPSDLSILFSPSSFRVMGRMEALDEHVKAIRDQRLEKEEKNERM